MSQILTKEQLETLDNEFTSLWEKLVPTSGEATTENGKLLRAIGRLEYDCYNNGNMNARESSNKISPFYLEFIERIESALPTEKRNMKRIRSIIKVGGVDDIDLMIYSNVKQAVVNKVKSNGQN